MKVINASVVPSSSRLGDCTRASTRNQAQTRAWAKRMGRRHERHALNADVQSALRMLDDIGFPADASSLMDDASMSPAPMVSKEELLELHRDGYEVGLGAIPVAPSRPVLVVRKRPLQRRTVEVLQMV